jgi:hypothetical protein
MSTVKIDDRIVQLYHDVQERKSELAKTQQNADRNWKTTCSYPLSNSGSVNIQTATVDQLRVIVGSIITEDRLQGEVGKLIPELAVSVSKVSGFAVADWLEDVNTRIAKMSAKKMAVVLTDLESKLNSILPADLKRELELQEIEKQFKDIAKPE